MENESSSFWQFSDRLRVQTNIFCNLSLNDSIWSSSHVSKRPEDRRNFDPKVGGEINPSISFSSNLNPDFSGVFSNNDGRKDVNNSGFKSNLDAFRNSMFKSDFNEFSNHGLKSEFDKLTNDSASRPFGSTEGVGDLGGMRLNGGFSKGIYSNSSASGMNFAYDKGVNNVVMGGKSIYGKETKGKEIYEHNNGDKEDM